ncbi:hypothetical protein BOTNAR_0460g00030 [Botryotinia narcissicola]|uniref:Uncharacterized protein n=1 Tax=Botryotinia narcissicola TaxID=278944 RepID=A0A4Z1HJE3_9HELO|nr:hypothetical protein BOTNAR_0460g00030 [Botryotinia narcissicola]
MEDLEGEFPSAEELAKSGPGAKKGKHLKAFWKAQCAFRGLNAEEDVKRFLRETFPINSNEDKAVLLKLRLRCDWRGSRKGPRKQWFKQLLRQWRKEPTFDNYILPHASEFGLDYEYIPGSRFDDPPNKWQDIMLMVVGRSRSTISEKVKDIGRSRHMAQQRAEEEARASIEEGSREVLRASKKQEWHVAGE